MRRLQPLALVLLAALAGAAACARGGAVASGDGSVRTLRRAALAVRVEPDSVSIAADSMPLVLRVTNTAREPMRLDFTGDPLFPRGPKERAMTPALWYQLERTEPTVLYVGHSQRRFRMADTVLGPGESFEVPLAHSLREVGFVTTGPHRIRVGLGAHASEWMPFTVTR